MTSPDLPRLRIVLLRWYRRNARPFPWRRTRDPYRVLVSEVMLQQTQAARVVLFYRSFLKQFPTVRKLASASPGSVLHAWRGLGYNMRALRLHAAAVDVIRHRQGKFPTTVHGLMELPGIGPYTARAVAIFAFGRAEAVVDTNVQRVLQRLYPRRTDRADFQDLADRLLARRASYDWNQAVMELGATICTPSSPKCHACPIAPFCPSAGSTARISTKSKSKERLHRGQPRRIYRGRVLALLLSSGRPRSRTDVALTRAVFRTSSPSDRRFIREVLLTLEKDGLVSIRSGRSAWMVGALR